MVAQIMESVAALSRAGHSVLVVSSGAVGTGAHEMRIFERPTTMARKQALAAIGQVRLMREFNSMLSTLGVESAQVLLTYENLGEHAQCLNAQNTLEELFNLGVVPVVNENDTVATEELRFGDNDRLSAMCASLLGAHYLFLLTDVDGVYTANPNVDASAKRIDVIPDVGVLRAQINTQSGPGSEFSTGGMESKLEAAHIATRGGVRTIIMCAKDVGKIPAYVEACCEPGANVIASFGTVCMAASKPYQGRERWIQSLPPRGKLIIVNGAVESLAMRKSLFSSDVLDVLGKFAALEPVSVCSQAHPDIVLAVGLCNYASADLVRIKGKTHDECVAEGEVAQADVVFDRTNLALARCSGGGDSPAPFPPPLHPGSPDSDVLP